MNENLIRQLAYKVLLKTGTPTGSDEWQQLFAELIVRECADIAAKNQADDMNWDISEIIKEHFGVEE